MEKILNYINGQWIDPSDVEYVNVYNPAFGEVRAHTPLSGVTAVDDAAQAAAQALPNWRRTPAQDRIQYLLKLRQLLKEHEYEIAKAITDEAGKTFEESKGELQRAVENLEVAAGIPSLMKGEFSEDIARGIDETMIRQPVGVGATIAPFNFPAMIPFWFMPYALATGNTYIVKPSEKVPTTMQIVFRLIDQVGFPPGVINLVNGSKETVNPILDHPLIRAVTFVGSTATAKYLYARCAANGKRVQAQGGAKNPVVIMPDADMDMTVKIVSESAFGSAGQRCLANSIVITVGDSHEPFVESLIAEARSRKVGYGMDEGVQTGAIVSKESKERIENLIGIGEREGANLVLDGRGTVVPGYEKGWFVRPTIFLDVKPGSEIWKTEIFGPVLSVMHVNTLDEAIALANSHQYGNQASIFTNSGVAARQFKYEIEAGNVGINIGVAAPMAFFPFSGWKDSFFGDMHGQGMDMVEFFTQKKIVVERWPKEWTRKF